MKHNKIYQQIRHEIISGVWKEGDKLPTETEYAAKFNVARNTLRNGLKMLEDDGFIERVKANGTFVRLPRVNPEDKNISLLVPCYEYLQYSGIHFMTLMFELIAEAAAAGWRVTPVIYSKTNSPEDIWYENLSHFNANSRIVVYNKWFAPYFKTLAGIGASVAFINNDADNNDDSVKYTAQWMNFIEEDKVAASKALEYLYTQGSRKIAISIPLSDSPDNSISAEYRKFTARRNLPQYIFNISKSNTLEDIRNACQENNIDGLLLHCYENKFPHTQSVHSAFGLAEDIPIVAVPLYYDNIYKLENIPIIEYRIKEMAHDIVKKLIGGQCIPEKLYYAPKLVLNGHEIKF